MNLNDERAELVDDEYQYWKNATNIDNFLEEFDPFNINEEKIYNDTYKTENKTCDVNGNITERTAIDCKLDQIEIKYEELLELEDKYDTLKNNTFVTYDQERFQIKEGGFLYDTYRYYKALKEYINRQLYVLDQVKVLLNAKKI